MNDSIKVDLVKASDLIDESILNKTVNKSLLRKKNLIKCHRTGEPIEFGKGFITYDHNDKKWIFQSLDAPEKIMDYSIQVSRILGSELNLLSWLNHLSEKTWFNQDDFMDFLIKLAKDNNINLAT